MCRSAEQIRRTISRCAGARFRAGHGAAVSGDRGRASTAGVEMMVHARDVGLPQNAPSLVPVAELWVARERARERRARCCHFDDARSRWRAARGRTDRVGRLRYRQCLVETLLERGADGDLAEVQIEIERLANLGNEGSAVLDITLLRLRTLAARATETISPMRSCWPLPRLAETLGFEGHIDSGQACPRDRRGET